jgi:hypothetical protein
MRSSTSHNHTGLHGLLPGIVFKIILSLVSIVVLLGRKCSGCDIEIREYGRRDLSRMPRRTLYPQKFALTSPTIGDRSRTQATEFSLVVYSMTLFLSATLLVSPSNIFPPFPGSAEALFKEFRSLLVIPATYWRSRCHVPGADNGGALVNDSAFLRRHSVHECNYVAVELPSAIKCTIIPFLLCMFTVKKLCLSQLNKDITRSVQGFFLSRYIAL